MNLTASCSIRRIPKSQIPYSKPVKNFIQPSKANLETEKMETKGAPIILNKALIVKICPLRFAHIKGNATHVTLSVTKKSPPFGSVPVLVRVKKKPV